MSATGWLAVVVKRNQAVYTIASAEDALKLLFSDWPVHSGLPFILAMEACAGAVTGVVTDEEAEFAFLTAAIDAQVSFEFP
ncbi:hypothetical protein J2W42_002187 [Rhizobium tibeticum]|uniref:DUF982 domain-containing protein n=1 Tax=Rhizobium tibeticum TaxID=501024 RepID=UPI00277FD144|nr:DUF982 domain-containing protein [Rhizobium tibeticum]MDP9809339.1 hypothetical protein [Rhizobium tibeticum]